VDIAKIVAALKQERDRLDRAIAALEGAESRAGRKKAGTAKRTPAKKPVRKLTRQGRKAISEAMKRRWSEAKEKGLARLG
jgi:hypothetical protein